MKRHYPDQPLVGVGAVIFKGGEVLLVRRGQEPAKDAWSLPGGLVELGESLTAALTREICRGNRPQRKNFGGHRGPGAPLSRSQW